jgi:hypothetical protein
MCEQYGILGKIYETAFVAKSISNTIILKLPQSPQLTITHVTPQHPHQYQNLITRF